MYKSGLVILQEYVRAHIDIQADRLPTQNRVYRQWFGSEQFLFKFVSALGEACNKTTHIQCLPTLDIPNTDKLPPWAREENVFTRELIKFMYEVDLYRIWKQWSTGVPSRDSQCSDAFLNVLRHFANIPEHLQVNGTSFLGPDMRRFIQSEGLYSWTMHQFFLRNPYNYLCTNYRNVDNVVFSKLQLPPKTCTDDVLYECINSRASIQPATQPVRLDHREGRLTGSVRPNIPVTITLGGSYDTSST